MNILHLILFALIASNETVSQDAPGLRVGSVRRLSDENEIPPKPHHNSHHKPQNDGTSENGSTGDVNAGETDSNTAGGSSSVSGGKESSSVSGGDESSNANAGETDGNTAGGSSSVSGGEESSSVSGGGDSSNASGTDGSSSINGGDENSNSGGGTFVGNDGTTVSAANADAVMPDEKGPRILIFILIGMAAVASVAVAMASFQRKKATAKPHPLKGSVMKRRMLFELFATHSKVARPPRAADDAYHLARESTGTA